MAQWAGHLGTASNRVPQLGFGAPSFVDGSALAVAADRAAKATEKATNRRHSLMSCPTRVAG
jgi:hypothetical protein